MREVTWAEYKIMWNQIRRGLEERDVLIGAIAPQDYDRVKDEMVAISLSPDQEPSGPGNPS